MKSDFFLLSSSLHEMILVKDDGNLKAEELIRMIIVSYVVAITCKNCGEKISPDASYCAACGTKVEEEQ